MTKTIKERKAELEKAKAAWIVAALAIGLRAELTDAEQDAAQVVLDAAWDELTAAKTALDLGVER